MTLALPGLVILACTASITALGDLRLHLPAFLALFFLAFAAYLFAFHHLRLARGDLRVILLFAAAYRLLLLPASPTLSDDLYRYVWEGRVLAAGLSPYRYAPDDAALRPLRDEAIWAHVNNLSVSSPYPPLAQLGGLLGYLLTPTSPLGVKLISTAGDVATIAAVLLLLRATGRAPAGVLVYAWNPLVLLAFSHSGHNDSLMVAPLTFAAVGAAAGHRRRTALWLAAAVLAKVTPLLLLPPLARRLGWRATVLAGATIAGAWLPFLWLGGGATGSIATYLGQWADNDSVHAIIRQIAGAPAAKALCLLLLGAGIAAVATHPVLRARPFWWQAYAILGLSIVLASTVHAWYLTWLLPFIAVQVANQDQVPAGRMSGMQLRDPALAWLLFSGLVALPYLTYDTHQWRLWISFAEYVPLYLLLALTRVWPVPGRLRLTAVQLDAPMAAAAD